MAGHHSARDIDLTRDMLITMMDGLAVGVCLLRDRHIVYINQRLIEMTGISHDEIHPDALDLLFDKTPRGRAYASKIYEKILNGELDSHVWNNPVTRPDGSVVHLRGIVKPIVIDGILYAIVNLRDVTQQHEAETIAREKNMLFELIGENSSDFIYVHDQESKLSYVSPGVEKITGYPADDWDQHTGKYLVRNDKLKIAIEATRLAFATGKKQPEYQVDILTKDGRLRTLEVNETPYAQDGKTAGIVGVARDITDRLESEEKLRDLNTELAMRNDHLVRANQEMEAFIYTVSHDLKAPLVTLHGMTDRLQKKYNDNLDERGRHYLERIKVNIDRLEELVLDLLELSRIGRMEEERLVIPLKQILSESMEQVGDALQEQEVSIDDSELHGMTIYSRKRLRQVFCNLLTNAAKYCDPLRSPHIMIKSEQKEEQWLIRFTDNGRGIDPRFHEKIFAAFQRPGSRREDEGTGIGLTIVKRIVEYNGGRIWVESTPGVGSTFWFTVPAYVNDSKSE